MHTTLDDWIQYDSIPSPVDSPVIFNDTIDKAIASLCGSVELLCPGEAPHGEEDSLMLFNGLFQRLVEAHGYSAIAIESSIPPGALSERVH